MKVYLSVNHNICNIKHYHYVLGICLGFLIGVFAPLNEMFIPFIAGLLVFAAVTLSPRLLLCLMFFLLPLIPLLTATATGQGIKGSVVFVVFDLLIMLSAISWLSTALRATVDRLISLSVILFGSYIIFSGTLSKILVGRLEDIKSVLVLLHAVLPYFWFLAGGKFLANARNKQLMILSFSVGSVVSAVWYLLQVKDLISTAPTISWNWQVVVASVGTNLNNLGLLYVLGIALLIPQGFHYRWIKWGVSMLLGIATLYTFSRSSYLALLAVIVYHLLKQRPKRLELFAIALVILVAVIITTPQAVIERIQYTWGYEARELDPSTLARLFLWREAFTTFLGNPIFGIGFANPSDLSISDLGLALDLSKLTFAHNYFLTLLSQGGVVGFLLGVYILLRGYILNKREEPKGFNQSFNLAFVALIVASMFGEPLLWTGTLFLFMSLLSGVAYHARRR